MRTAVRCLTYRKIPLSTGLYPSFSRATALPLIFVMGMNGLMTVVDALFLGHYVGAAALGAVTLMFPLYMLIIALATLVGTGMASPPRPSPRRPSLHRRAPRLRQRPLAGDHHRRGADPGLCFAGAGRWSR